MTTTTTSPLQLEDIDLTEGVPCEVEDCPRPADWRCYAVGCPRGHAWLVCDGHRRHELEALAHNRAVLGDRFLPECGSCRAPLHEPHLRSVLL